MDPRMLDGNAVAGTLQEVFAVEITTAVGTCDGCGATEPVGAIHVFEGAGLALRCPHCDHTLVKLVRDGSRMWLGFPGLRTLEVAVPQA